MPVYWQCASCWCDPGVRVIYETSAHVWYTARMEVCILVRANAPGSRSESFTRGRVLERRKRARAVLHIVAQACCLCCVCACACVCVCVCACICMGMGMRMCRSGHIATVALLRLQACSSSSRILCGSTGRKPPCHGKGARSTASPTAAAVRASDSSASSSSDPSCHSKYSHGQYRAAAVISLRGGR